MESIIMTLTRVLYGGIMTVQAEFFECNVPRRLRCIQNLQVPCQSSYISVAAWLYVTSEDPLDVFRN